jgi:hypothetical protein
MKTIALFCALFCLVKADSLAAEDGVPSASRYPTYDETFYVLACQEMNGQNAEGLQKCSRAINRGRASLRKYSDTALVFAMRQAGGESAALYRDTVAMKEIADRFIRAQARANRQCFGRDGSPAK